MFEINKSCTSDHKLTYCNNHWFAKLQFALLQNTTNYSSWNNNHYLVYLCNTRHLFDAGFCLYVFVFVFLSLCLHFACIRNDAVWRDVLLGRMVISIEI